MLESVRGEIVGGHGDLLFLATGPWVLQIKTTPSIAAALRRNIPVTKVLYLAIEWPTSGAPGLIGFPDRAVRELYLALLGINGVGPGIALNALDGVEPIDLLRAIAGKDYQFLTALPKIGKARAENLVAQIMKSNVTLPNPIEGSLTTWISAREALIKEGYELLAVEEALSKVADSKMKVADLIMGARKCL